MEHDGFTVVEVVGSGGRVEYKADWRAVAHLGQWHDLYYLNLVPILVVSAGRPLSLLKRFQVEQLVRAVRVTHEELVLEVLSALLVNFPLDVLELEFALFNVAFGHQSVELFLALGQLLFEPGLELGRVLPTFAAGKQTTVLRLECLEARCALARRISRSCGPHWQLAPRLLLAAR